MLTDRDRVALERVGDRMRERYRHLLAEDAERRFRVREAAARKAREMMVDKYGAEEIHGEPEDD